MRLFHSLARRDRPVDTGELSRLGWDDFDEDDRGKGRVYDPHYVPPGGWDRWCEWASEQGKMAHIIHSRAKNAMAFSLVSSTPKIQAAADEMMKRVHLRSAAIELFRHRDVFGRCIIEPVWSIRNGKRTGLAAVKPLYPPSVRVFRDTDQDVTALQEYLMNTPDAAYGRSLRAGAGDTVIGYVQHWDWQSAGGDPSVFFKPDELIFIPRYPNPRNPDGLSLLKQNHVLVMNKLGIERDQAIMARRHGDPKHKFFIPDSMWDQRDEIKGELKKGIRGGLDFFFRGRGRHDADTDRMDVDIVEPKGNPAAVIKAQQHIENQFNASMGWADSFTESTSSNRSVGYIQLSFWERNLEPERQLFAEILTDQLIDPWLRSQGFSPGSVSFRFADLTPEDRLEKARIVASVLPYLPASAIKQFLEEMGYPIDDQGKEEITESARARRTELHRTGITGYPRPVIRGVRTSREQIRDEIEALRDDIGDVLGIR